ncbi:MAG: SLC13 family permease [candidate division WOR-3 bacterium]
MFDFELKDIFSPDLVFIDSEPKTQKEVFAFVADKLKEKKLISDNQVSEVISALNSREEIGSTGLGKGIAIPHITFKNSNKIFGFIYKNDKSIEWQSIDGKPVKLIVFLFAPEAKRQEYLSVLAEVARVLNLPQVLEKILKENDPLKIYKLLTGEYEPSFWAKYSKYFYFIFGVLAIIILAKLFLSYVKVPNLEIYEKLDYLKFNEPVWITKEIIATTLFFSMVLGTLLFFRYRVAFGAAALSLLLIAGVMDIETTVKFMSIPTILFIVAVMIMVKWFEDKGVFQYLVIKALKYFYGSPLLLFGALMFFSCILAGLVDEVSAILITIGIAVEISRHTKTNIIPYLLGLVMATNVGSALTLIGNPIGIYLAFAGKLTFLDFLKNSTVISILTAILIIGLIVYIYRKQIKSKIAIDINELESKMEIKDKKEISLAIIIFIIFVILVIMHSFLEKALRVEERTVLLATVLAIVGFIVLREEERGRYFIEKGPDWWTVLYFMFLFANAACLEYTGVTAKVAHIIMNAGQILPLHFMGNLSQSANVLTILLWSSGLLSGFVDNLPVVAALVPVVKDLIASGLPKANILWWSLLIGGCFGGNLTMIGSTANLVAIGVFERSYRRKFSFKQWLKLGIIITLITLLFANFLLLIKLRFSR